MAGKPDRKDGAVLITGASTGIGRACALELDRLGFKVFAGVRKEADAAILRNDGSSRLHPLIMDITDPEAIREAEAETGSRLEDGGLSGLVNNAGIGIGGAVEYLDLDSTRFQFEVNVFSQLAVIRAFLPLIRSGNGRIVNIGSVSGRIPSPFLSPYCASKSALASFTASLRQELHPWGIHACMVEPGQVQSAIWDKSAAQIAKLRDISPPEAIKDYGPIFDAWTRNFEQAAARAAPPSRVIKAVIHALTSRRPRTRYLVGTDARVANAFKILLPEKIFESLARRALRLQ